MGAGEVTVEHNDVVACDRQPGAGVVAVEGDVDRHAFTTQADRHRVGENFVVFGYQDSHTVAKAWRVEGDSQVTDVVTALSPAVPYNVDMEKGRALLAAVGVGIALGGCGGSKSPSVASITRTATRSTASRAGSGAAAGEAQSLPDALKFARCMRANGVPDFPDPSPGGGFQFSPGTGIDPSSAAVQAAQAKCRRFMPGPALGSRTQPSPKWLAHMVKVAECMRRHGVPGFPDPTTSIPTSMAGVGEVSDIEGAIFVFPDTLVRESPVFTRAAAACDFPLHNH